MNSTHIPSRIPVRPRCWLFTLVVGSVLLTSCGKSDRVAVSPVRGQVFSSRQEPAAGALVVFHPVAPEDEATLRPLAYVDDQGNFELTTYDQGDGAPLGEYVITVEWREKPAHPFSPNKEGKDRLAGKLNDPSSSEYRFTVEEGAEQVVPAIYLE
jgi:hypothetical protein